MFARSSQWGFSNHNYFVNTQLHTRLTEFLLPTRCLLCLALLQSNAISITNVLEVEHSCSPLFENSIASSFLFVTRIMISLGSFESFRYGRSYNMLIRKLKFFFRFSNTSARLIHSYLFQCSQSVFLKGKWSDFLPLDKGVPQGTILEPLCFSLYVND